VIFKAAHTKFTLNNVIVGEGGLDLKLDSRAAVKVLTMLCGDINGDGFINVSDLNIILLSQNYNKYISQAVQPLCDLNGDGFINVSDLNIVLLTANYNKGAVVIKNQQPTLNSHWLRRGCGNRRLRELL